MDAVEKQNAKKKINNYKGKIKTNKERISSMKAEISKLESNYESLRSFKGIVQNSSNGFYDLIQSNKQYLAPVSTYANTNNCAKEYAEGMSHTLSGFGVKIVVVAFGGFLLKIQHQLDLYKKQINDYYNKIDTLNANNSRYNSEISRLERELAKGDD